jgi:hypothetical protein
MINSSKNYMFRIHSISKKLVIIVILLIFLFNNYLLCLFNTQNELIEVRKITYD